MNKNITDREDLFWAKIAGRDVDISTMTPPVAASVREELMLEVAERIGAGGGGSSLPPAGADGNVLTADDGEWVSAPPTDNDYIIEAELTVDLVTQSFGVSPVEHDIADVYAAAAANKNIRLIAVNDTLGIHAAIDAVRSQLQEDIIFSGTMTGFDGKPIAFVVKAENVRDAAVPTIKFTAVTVPTLPDPDDNDGKILGVSSGAYALVDSVSGITRVPFEIANDFSVSTEISIADIYAASLEGDVVAVSTVPGAEKDVHLPLTWVSETSAYFCGNIEMGGGINVPVAFNGNSEHDVDTWDPAFVGAAIPVPTASDYLKVLKVGRQSDGQGGYTYLYGLDVDNASLVLTGDVDVTTFAISNLSTDLASIYAAAQANKAVRIHLVGSDNNSYIDGYMTLANATSAYFTSTINLDDGQGNSANYMIIIQLTSGGATAHLYTLTPTGM